MASIATTSDGGSRLFRGSRESRANGAGLTRKIAGRVSLPGFEVLENRALRSSLPLGGFPTGGFRSDVLDGGPTWDVSITVDGEPVTAVAFNETTTKRLNDAPTVEIIPTDSTWIAGLIGDSRRGRTASTNDVDIYRIELDAGEHYSLGLSVLAQRFGSSLDSAVSLFDSAGRLIATNDDALHDGALSDAELFAGVNGVTYYVVVSAGGNTPDRPDGFDPLVPDSGTSSYGSTGQYLLRITAEVDNTPPEVVQTTIDADAVLTTPLTQIKVQFSEPMQLLGLMEGASLIGPGGLSIDLIATDYNADTLEVTYQLRERPVPGDYVFSLSGDVRDHADLSVVGDGLGTGYALSFTLDIAPLPTAEVEPNGTVGAAQDLGPLYAAELRDGVVIDGVVDASGDQDYYRFEVTRQGLYTFRLISETRGQTGQLLLRDAEGNLLAQGIRFPGAGSVLFRFLKAGSYIVQMDGLGVPDGEAYSLSIQSAADAETPLVDSYTGPSVSVVLSTRDGERAPASRQASTSSVPIIVAGEAIAYSVRFVPTVGSQPVGRAQAPSAAETEFAWADMSAAKRVLPAGIYLGRRVETATQYSVASVSGSFLEPLPEIVFDGASTSDATLQVAAEFRAALRAWRAGETPEAGPEIIEAVAFRFRGSRNGSDPSGEEVHAHQDADAPSGWAFGMVASLSVVGASSTQNRRRTANWVRQTFEWIGID